MINGTTQRTYSLSSSKEHNKPLEMKHCTCSCTCLTTFACGCMCECENNKWQNRKFNKQFLLNDQWSSNQALKSTNQFFISNRSTNLTYTLESSPLKNSMNVFSQHAINDNPLYSSLPEIENKCMSSMKQTPPPYSYFHQLSIDNLKRFKESNGNQKQKRIKKGSNDIQRIKRDSNSFDDSLKRKLNKRSSSCHSKSKPKISSASKGNRKTFERQFTNLDLIANSSRPHSLDKTTIEDQNALKEIYKLHFDYSKPCIDSNEYYSLNDYSNRFALNDKVMPSPNQLYSKMRFPLNKSNESPHNYCNNNQTIEYHKGKDSNRLMNQQNAYDSQYDSSIRNYHPKETDIEEEKRRQKKEERERKFQLEKEDLRQRRKNNEDLKKKEKEDELNRNAYIESKRSQREIDEKQRQGEDRRNKQHAMRLIEKYTPNTNNEPKINQNNRSINEKNNYDSTNHNKNHDDKSIYNKKGSNLSLMQNQDITQTLNNSSSIMRNKDIKGNNHENVSFSNNEPIQYQNNHQQEGNIYLYKQYSPNDIVTSKNRKNKIEPIEQINNDNYNDCSIEEKQIELNDDKPQIKPKLKPKTVLKQSLGNKNNDNNNDIIENNNNYLNKQRHSLKNSSNNISQKLLNLRTKLDNSSNEDDDNENEPLSYSCDKSTHQLSKIEKKIFDWINDLSSPIKEGKKNYGVKKLNFNIKAQNIIDTIRKSTMSSSNDLKKMTKNDNKFGLNVISNAKHTTPHKVPSLINNNKTIIGKALLKKQKSNVDFYKENKDLNSKKNNDHCFKSSIPYSYTKELLYYTKNNNKKGIRQKRNSSALAGRSSSIDWCSYSNSKITKERHIRDDTIMPPNPFESVIQAREFFFFDD